MSWLHIRTEQLVIGSTLAGHAELEEALLVQLKGDTTGPVGGKA